MRAPLRRRLSSAGCVPLCIALVAGPLPGMQAAAVDARAEAARGDALAAAGDHLRALTAYRAALRLLDVGMTNLWEGEITEHLFYRLGPGVPDLPLASSLLARIGRAHLRLALAERPDFGVHAVGLAHSLRLSVDALEMARGRTPPSDVLTRLAIADSLRARTDEVVAFLYQAHEGTLSGDTPILEDPHHTAFFYADRARSRLLLDLVRFSRGLGNPASNRGREVRAARWLLSGVADRALVIERTRDDPDPVRLRAVRTFSEWARASAEQAGPPPTPADLELQARTGGWGLIRSALGFGETLVEYHVAGEAIYIFLIPRRGDLVMRRAPRTVTEVRQTVLAYVRQLRNPRSFWRPNSERLYLDLIAPVQQYLRDTDRLYVVPHDFLNLVPVRTLVDPLSGEPMIERMSTVYLPSANTAFYLGASGGDEVRVLGISDFDGESALAFAEDEADAVATALGGCAPSGICGRDAQLLRGSRREASKANLLRGLESVGILHLATHGRFDPINPLASHVIVQDDRGRDAPLYAFEVLQSRLRARLVTLSACRTSVTDERALNHAGELFGLPWAFLFAGARNVVASLWNVNDASTRELMEDFYRSMARGASLGVDEDLRNAQLEQHRAGRHPYYWGAFLLIGVPR